MALVTNLTGLPSAAVIMDTLACVLSTKRICIGNRCLIIRWVGEFRGCGSDEYFPTHSSSFERSVEGSPSNFIQIFSFTSLYCITEMGTGM